jgi:hypothetical protein
MQRSDMNKFRLRLNLSGSVKMGRGSCVDIVLKLFGLIKNRDYFIRTLLLSAFEQRPS